MIEALITPRSYRYASLLATPVIDAWLAHRRRRGKEDEARFGERLGRPSLPRPYLWGSPLYVAADADDAAMEDARLTLEERLNALTAEADRMVGAEPIEPAGDTTRADDRRAAAAPAGVRP